MPLIDDDDLEIPEFLRAKSPVDAVVAKIEETEGDPLGLPDEEIEDEFYPEGKPNTPIEKPKGKKAAEPKPEEPKSNRPAGIARDQLRAIVERVEKLEEEKKAVADDIKEVYAEAKANGFDSKTIKKVIAIRKQDAAERQEQEALLDLYLFALGMIPADD
jgi:uncharacterized protein (UPF0335 family)